MVTFAQATYFLATFVHVSIISAVTDLILTELFGALIFVDQYFWPNYFLDHNFFLLKYFYFFDPNIFWPKKQYLFLYLHFFLPHFLVPKICSTQNIFASNFFLALKLAYIFLHLIVLNKTTTPTLIGFYTVEISLVYRSVWDQSNWWNTIKKIIRKILMFGNFFWMNVSMGNACNTPPPLSLFHFQKRMSSSPRAN